MRNVYPAILALGDSNVGADVQVYLQAIPEDLSKLVEHPECRYLNLNFTYR